MHNVCGHRYWPGGESESRVSGARIIVEGVSEKWLNWDSEGNAADIC